MYRITLFITYITLKLKVLHCLTLDGWILVASEIVIELIKYCRQEKSGRKSQEVLSLVMSFPQLLFEVRTRRGNEQSMVRIQIVY